MCRHARTSALVHISSVMYLETALHTKCTDVTMSCIHLYACEFTLLVSHDLSFHNPCRLTPRIIASFTVSLDNKL